MKNAIFTVILILIATTSFAQGNDDEFCQRFSEKRRIQKKYGEWLSKRNSAYNVIHKLKLVNSQDEIVIKQIAEYGEKFDTLTSILSTILDSVITKLQTGEITYVIRGVSLTENYRNKFAPVLQSLDSLTQVMIAYHNSISSPRINAFGGIETLISIIEAIAPAIIDEVIVPNQVRKTNCLRWKKWQQI